MRIVGGQFRGRRLQTPPGLATRPMADRVREALFSILGPEIQGRRVLDLFSGTGSLGLEALSRGAAEAVFVDKRPEAVAAIRRNIEALGLGPDRARVVRADLTKGPGPLAGLGGFDLIFVDPPYDQGLIPGTLDLLTRQGLASEQALLAAQHRDTEVPAETLAGWRLAEQRKYGQTVISFYTLEKTP